MWAEKYFAELLAGRRPSFFLKPILYVLSRLYRLGVACRHFAYDHRLFSIHSAGVWTVSVGNIVVGGAGKTPLVQLLVHSLAPSGEMAVLTRGFRSQAENRGEPLLLKKGSGLSAAIAGDEPLLLAETTPATVWVGADRVKSAQHARAAGARCLILDDGLQHRRLHRDCEIIVVDANNLFDQRRFLPFGRLRDLPERLKVADLIVASRTKNLNQYQAVKKALSEYTQAPVVAMQHVIAASPEWHSGSVGVFCGIAQPQSFLESIALLGINVVVTERLLDHQPISMTRLRQLVGEAQKKGAKRILCTEKDSVKLPKEAFYLPLPVEPVPMQLKIIGGKEAWDRLIEKIRDRI